MAIITKIKVNNSIIKLVAIKGGYKVSWCGMKREFTDIEAAIKYYSDTVASFVRTDAVMAVHAHNAKVKAQ